MCVCVCVCIKVFVSMKKRKRNISYKGTGKKGEESYFRLVILLCVKFYNESTKNITVRYECIKRKKLKNS